MHMVQSGGPKVSEAWRADLYARTSKSWQGFAIPEVILLHYLTIYVQKLQSPFQTAAEQVSQILLCILR